MISTQTPTRPEGSQSIVRAAALLSHVAACAASGARLSKLVEVSRLNIATTRRILQALVAEGLLAFDAKSKIYTIGPAIYAFAVSGHPVLASRDLFRPVLDAIAKRLDDTVLFSVRGGDEAVCLVRREGAFPIRVMSLQEGSRRPLGAGSGSLAILAFLDADERASILERCAPLYGDYGLSADIVATGVAEARREGFSFNPGRIIDGVYGIGVPVLRDGRAAASISVVAIAARMPPPRRKEIVDVIGEELAILPGYAIPGQTSAVPAPPDHKVA